MPALEPKEAKTPEEAKEIAQARLEAKLEIVKVANELMPAGDPRYLEIVKYPKITDLVVQTGENGMILLISALIRDFCGAFNIVRNMNAEQIVEAAAMLLFEAGNFRLEDYVMMFAMAKRGELYEVRDRIDIQVITAIADKYWGRRHLSAVRFENEQAGHLEGLGPAKDQIQYSADTGITTEVHKLDKVNGFGLALMQMKENYKEVMNDRRMDPGTVPGTL